MELVSSRVVKVTQSEIAEAILNLVFKNKPELRPSGTDASEPAPEVYFQGLPNGEIAAVVTLESETRKVVKS